MGESLDISAYTNSSTVRIRITAPDGSQIYDKVWQANETRKLPTNEGSVYGTYRIIGEVGDVKTETWITLIDETGFSPASFPISKTIHNVEYTIYSNWTLRGFNPYLGEMWIDFTALRDIVNEYGMTRSAYINKGSFLIRLNKGAYAVDLRLIKVHDGLKIKINGTLSGARRFPIKFPKAETYLKNILKSGNYRIDYGDLSGFKWDGENINGSVSGTFDYDPIIYTWGFESGSFAGEGIDGINLIGIGNATVVMENPNSGLYSAKIEIAHKNNDGAYFFEMLNNQPELWVSGSFLMNVTLEPWTETRNLIALLNTNLFRAGFDRPAAGDVNPQLYLMNNTAQEVFLNTTMNIDVTKRQNILIHAKLSSADNVYDAEYQYYINGSLVLNVTNIDSDKTFFNQFRSGQMQWISNTIPTALWVDDIIISNTSLLIPPTVYYLNAENLGISTLIGGYNATVSMDLETNSTPAYYWFGNTLSGTEVNLTAQSWVANGTVYHWFWVPAQYGLAFQVQGYGNSTDVENGTGIFNYVIGTPAFGGVGGGAIGLILLILILIPIAILMGLKKK